MFVLPGGSRALSSMLFISALLAGVAFDVRARRVPNWLVVLLLVFGVMAAAGRVSFAQSLSDALWGCVAGLAIWIPFWLLGLLGAGDVKFFAASALWIGLDLAWRASLLTALLGGAMGLVMMIAQRGLRRAMGEVALQAQHAHVVLASANAGDADAKMRTFPYALPMALALGIAAFSPQWLTGR